MTDEADGAVGADYLALADWRRRISDLYGEVRATALKDPREAWSRWRAVRDDLYRHHLQSPVPAPVRVTHAGRYWPYDPALRYEVEVSAAEGASPADLHARTDDPFLILPMSTGEAMAFTTVGSVTIRLPSGTHSLDVFWMSGYAGGLFLPFRDATNGHATYGAGRYLLDTAKGADLGGVVAEGWLILDFNFAFQPSCAFDSRWACPLAPPQNRLDVPIEAGERLT